MEEWKMERNGEIRKRRKGRQILTQKRQTEGHIEKERKTNYDVEETYV